MCDGVAGAVPPHLALTHPTSSVQLVGYLTYGILVKSAQNDSDESLRQFNYGLKASYVGQTEATRPWVGVFAGLETLNAEEDGKSGSFKGWQAGLQGGACFPVAPGFSLGPFTSFAVGEFTSVKLQVKDASPSDDVDADKEALHQWLTVGVRGQFDF